MATDIAQIEHANTMWGRAVTRLRLLEKELDAAFAELAAAEVGQEQAGNGVAAPAMTPPVKQAWKVYLHLHKQPREQSDFDIGHPPILDWQDP
jgi:hypothetical protein